MFLLLFTLPHCMTQSCSVFLETIVILLKINVAWMPRMTVSLSFEILNGTDSLNRYQPRQMREGEQASAQGSNEAPLSWFDQDNTSDDRSGKETGQRSNTQRERSSYRQGIMRKYIWMTALVVADILLLSLTKIVRKCSKLVIQCVSG